jgi:hypothetical protein
MGDEFIGVKVVNFDKEMTRARAKMDSIARHDLNLAIRRAVTSATKPTRIIIRESIRAALPKKGGLNRWVGKTPTAHTTFAYGPHPASIKLTLDVKGHDLRRMNRTGKARHPVFGNRKRWAVTEVPVEFFEKPLIVDGPRVKADVTKAVSDVIEQSWSKK